MIKIVNIDSIIQLKNKTGLLSVEDISQKKDCNMRPSRFFGWSLFLYDDYIQWAKKYFNNQVVVDIGSGTDISLFRVCCIANAKGYIGVDYSYNYDAVLMKHLLSKQYWDKHETQFKNAHLSDERLNHQRKVPVGLAYENAQDFLARLPDNSVSIYAGGIDMCMVPFDEDARKLESEIVRVLSTKGAFISNCSRLFRKIMNYVPENELSVVTSYKGYPDMEVRIKVN